MRGRTTRVSVQSRHYNKSEQIQKISQGLQLLQRKSSSICIGKQHSIYEVFTAKVGKVAGEGKL